MKRFNYIYVLIALLCSTSCVQPDINKATNDKGLTPDTIKVSFEDGNDTRVQLKSKSHTWTNGDAVSVFYMNDKNQKWQNISDTGSSEALLEYVGGDNASAQTSEIITIVLPYDENNTLNNDNQQVKTSLTATQTYCENSYGSNGYVMVASSSFGSFKLRSVCGWISISLYGEGEVVKSITIRGNNNEKLAGEIFVEPTTAEYTFVNDKDAAAEVVLDCGDGVVLNKTNNLFYIGILPQTFYNGFTVELEIEGREKVAVSTTEPISILRNSVLPMDCIDSNGNVVWKTIGECVYIDDMFAPLYGVNAGSSVTATLQERITEPGYYRLLDVFCESNMEAILGGRPNDMTCCITSLEFDATNPEAVFIPFQPVGVTIKVLGEVWIAGASQINKEYGKLVNGNISFPPYSLALLNENGSGHYTNTSGLFKIILPGYANKTETLATPELKIENVSGYSSTIAWNSVDNAVAYSVNDGNVDHIVYDTYFTMENFEPGTYTVRVKAVADNDSVYYDSDYAEIVVCI